MTEQESLQQDSIDNELKMGETHTEWICTCCEGEPHFLHKEFVEHVKTIHGIEPGTQGTRKMLMHLDEQEYARSTYEWTIGEFTFTQLSIHRRAEDDMMRWA